jgi:hypothetical protein
MKTNRYEIKDPTNKRAPFLFRLIDTKTGLAVYKNGSRENVEYFMNLFNNVTGK